MKHSLVTLALVVTGLMLLPAGAQAGPHGGGGHHGGGFGGGFHGGGFHGGGGFHHGGFRGGHRGLGAFGSGLFLGSGLYGAYPYYARSGYYNDPYGYGYGYDRVCFREPARVRSAHGGYRRVWVVRCD